MFTHCQRPRRSRPLEEAEAEAVSGIDTEKGQPVGTAAAAAETEEPPRDDSFTGS